MLDEPDLNTSVAIDQIGGSVLGFLAAAAFADSQTDVDMPTWTIAAPAEITSKEVADALRSIVRSYGSILVKQSGVAESFSASSARGVNSSRGSHLRGLVESDVASYAIEVPSRADSRMVILQGLIPRDAARGNSHIYATRHHVEVETVFDGQRVLFSRSGATEVWERVPASMPARERDIQVLGAASVGERFVTWAESRFLDVQEWNIEGEWDIARRVFWIFQARPAPPDRPSDTSAARGAGYSTRYVWGSFDVTVDWRSTQRTHRGVDNMVVLDQRSNRALELESVRTQISEGKRVLVIDTASAFRLSHESDHLLGGEERALYQYVHIPPELLESWRGRNLVRIWSDGDTAHAVASPRE